MRYGGRQKAYLRGPAVPAVSNLDPALPSAKLKNAAVGNRTTTCAKQLRNSAGVRLCSSVH
jgi:hypothetical protein